MFEMFEPIAVPKAMSSFPLITADIATNISGAEVPAAMRVNPTTRSLIPKCFAITEEWSTNLFAPQTSIVIPKRSWIKFKASSMTVF